MGLYQKIALPLTSHRQHHISLLFIYIDILALPGSKWQYEMDVNDMHYILMCVVLPAHRKVVTQLVATTDQLASRPIAEYIQQMYLSFVPKNSMIVTTNRHFYQKWIRYRSWGPSRCSGHLAQGWLQVGLRSVSVEGSLTTRTGHVSKLTPFKCTATKHGCLLLIMQGSWLLNHSPTTLHSSPAKHNCFIAVACT